MIRVGALLEGQLWIESQCLLQSLTGFLLIAHLMKMEKWKTVDLSFFFFFLQCNVFLCFGA